MAVMKETNKCFFNVLRAQHTTIAWRIHILPSEKFPCAQSVLQKEPKEDFMFMLA
jgi:hypothetical protein